MRETDNDELTIDLAELFAVLWERARKRVSSRLQLRLPGFFKSITDRREYHDHKHKL